MPEISRFLGIIVYMFYNDHEPAHFHVTYGDYQATIDIESGNVVGKFPRRALSLAQEWRKKYKNELLTDWELARAHKRLQKVPPLE